MREGKIEERSMAIIDRYWSKKDFISKISVQRLGAKEVASMGLFLRLRGERKRTKISATYRLSLCCSSQNMPEVHQTNPAHAERVPTPF